jgi:hypothetical protein
MSARSPRRTFANPFVLTLAALPVAACTVQTAPPPQGPTTTTTTANTNTAQVGMGAPGADSSNDLKWNVTRRGTTCDAYAQVSCPKGMMCNPPPPQKYTCPPQLADGGSMSIIQRTGMGDCYVDFGEVKCPPNATCNPPRPEKVACPK